MMREVVQLQATGRWPADVQVWRVAIPLAGGPVDETVLDRLERERASRYRHPGDRMRYAITRATLRELLGQRLGAAPESLRFVASRYGRPELACSTGSLSFNVSHSGDHALIAMSDARTVGIDVEHVDTALDWQELVDLVCTEDERRALREQSVWLQRQSFFRYWTAKEALLKALGLGITEGLRALMVDPAGDGVRHPVVERQGVFARAGDLQYHWLADIPGYMGCVAFGRRREAHMVGVQQPNAPARYGIERFLR